MPFSSFIPASLLSLYHFAWALIGAWRYGFPSRRLTVIGVTGTKGKTTVTELLAAILELAGNRVALANGLRFKIGSEETPNSLKMTMPGRGRLQRLLRDADRAGCRYAIIEVTSEGIRQHRHRFINFSIAALTNLQRDHIEAHGSFEAYRAAKGAFFKGVKTIHVLNADDPNVEYFKRFRAKEKIYFSKDDFEQYRAFQPASLPGEFNLYNIACAARIAQALGVPRDVIVQAISRFAGVPGRMQFIQREPFAVIVDYAHTPDSLEAVYQTVREMRKPNRLICVLGAAGGGRDKWKRPVMGSIAANYCNEIILTDEDPYDEHPEQIVAEIRAGISNAQLPITTVILDRREAIKRALAIAKPNDAVVITGKGAERFMVIGRKKIPWSDAEIVQEALTHHG